MIDVIEEAHQVAVDGPKRGTHPCRFCGQRSCPCGEWPDDCCGCNGEGCASNAWYSPPPAGNAQANGDGDGMCHAGPGCRCFCRGCGEHLERCECDDGPDAAAQLADLEDDRRDYFSGVHH